MCLNNNQGGNAVFSRTKKTLLGVLAAVVVVAALGAGTASAALPVKYSFPAAMTNSVLSGATAPAGANQWTCRPSSAHPRPVILVHGTIENQKSNWSAAAPLLKNDGYCVYTLNYGSGLFTLGQFYGLDKVADGAGELASFVDRVRSSTGASKVDIVGHSQGGLGARYYVQKLGGASKVENLVGLSAPNNGTTFSGILKLASIFPGVDKVFVYSWCKSCADQVAGSSLVNNLNAGGNSPNVRYTNIATKYDEVVTPYTSAFLAGGDVTNITVQDGCAKDYSEHLAIAYDQRALWYVRKALDPSMTGSAPCVPVVPLVGG
jgi:triacylglycerol esterase/lipase EstA (alpha/beta hydrolase family)